MAIPGFQELTLPVLREYANGRERTTRDVRDRIALQLGLTSAELAEQLPSRRAFKCANRAAWAHFYLKQAALLESPRRGVYRITERGRGVLSSPPGRIDIPFLMQYPEMVEFRKKSATDKADDSGVDDAHDVAAERTGWAWRAFMSRRSAGRAR